MIFRKELERRLHAALLRADTEEISNIVDELRFRYGANYRGCQTLATKVSGISTGEWEELLYESDRDTED